MAKYFDTITRTLLESHPNDWLALLGLGRGLTARVVDSDVSTVTAEADKVLRVEAPEPYLVHVEVQANYDRMLPRRLLRYNSLLNVRHDLPVLSVAVLLVREAGGPAIDVLIQFFTSFNVRADSSGFTSSTRMRASMRATSFGSNGVAGEICASSRCSASSSVKFVSILVFRSFKSFVAASENFAVLSLPSPPALERSKPHVHRLVRRRGS